MARGPLVISFTDDSFSLHFSRFDFLILSICCRCQTFSQPLMPTIRGDCGHLKELWHNHTVFLILFVLDILHAWCVRTGSIWELADKRRLHCSRRLTMTKTNTESKKKKISTQIYLRTFQQRTWDHHLAWLYCRR